MSLKEYRVCEAYRDEATGIVTGGCDDFYFDAETSEQAARMAAEEWDWKGPFWDGGDVIIATDDHGDTYHLFRED